MEKEEISHLISQSFLSDSQKQHLMAMNNEESDREKLFEAFNMYLIDEIQKKGEMYRVVFNDFGSAIGKLDKELQLKKSDLITILETKLASIQPAEVKQKKVIWREYYESIDNLRKEYERGLGELISKVIISI